MAKYDIPALTTWANKSASQFWQYAKREYAKKNFDIGKMPEVVMNPRLTATAGRAFDCGTKIDLSCYLMTRNYEAFHEDTIPHELCHIIANKLGSTGHDKIWYDVVAYLEVKTERCHSYGTKAQHDRGIK